MSDLLERFEERQMPTTDVPICLNLNLLAQRDEAMADLARIQRQQTGDQRMSGGEISSARAAVAALEDQIRAASITLRLTGVDRTTYNRYLLANPPRKAKQESFNAATFFMYVAQRTASYIDKAGVEHPITDDEWKAIDEKITDGEHDRIAQAVITVNREVGSVDLGFLSHGSATTRDSFGISVSPEPSASRPAASGAGSRKKSTNAGSKKAASSSS